MQDKIIMERTANTTTQNVEEFKYLGMTVTDESVVTNKLREFHTNIQIRIFCLHFIYLTM
jgi:hypothetical protein